MTMGITAGLTYPFDLINTRLASDMTKKGSTRLFTTTFDCFNRTNIDEGFKKGLYKGLDLCVVSSALRAAITLPLLDVLRSKSVLGNEAIEKNQMLHNFVGKIGISMVCSLTMSLLLYPLDTAKRCMQLNGSRGHLANYDHSYDCIRKIVTHEGGARALYRGVHIYLLKELFTAFTQLNIYDVITQLHE